MPGSAARNRLPFVLLKPGNGRFPHRTAVLRLDSTRRDFQKALPMGLR